MIGDARAHDAEEYGKGIDLSGLVDDASRKRIRFIVIETSSIKNNDLKRKTQLHALAEGRDAGGRGFFSTISKNKEASLTYRKTLKESIENEIERAMQLEKVRNRKITLDDVVPSNRAIFLKNMPASGHSSKGIHFNTGWISEQSLRGDLQTETYVFMTRSELDLYLAYMQTAVAMGCCGKTTDKAIAHNIMAAQISAMTGTSYKADANLKDHLQKKLAIPALQSGLLDFSLAEISTWSDARKKEMLNYIRIKRKALDNFSDDPSNWKKPAGSGFEYAFVPLSYFL